MAISPSGRMIAVANADSRSSNFRGSAYVFTRPARGWADDTDGMGDNVRVLTAADADTNPNHRYGFGGRGFAFIGENRLLVGQPAQVWALYKKDGLSSLPAGGLYGANADHSNLANVSQGSVYLFVLRTAASTYTPPPPPPPTWPEEPEPPEFDDVDDGFVHAESISTVAQLEIMTGTTAAAFSPSRTVTRAEMATFLDRTWHASGRDCPPSALANFDDVAADSAHAASINCMSALGITRGTAAGSFSPSQTVTRAQVATFLTRVWQAGGRTCPATGALSFDDVAADSVHAASIDCMSALGIARGTAAGVFLPSQTVTRAQMAAFLARFYQAFTVV